MRAHRGAFARCNRRDDCQSQAFKKDTRDHPLPLGATEAASRAVLRRPSPHRSEDQDTEAVLISRATTEAVVQKTGCQSSGVLTEVSVPGARASAWVCSAPTEADEAESSAGASVALSTTEVDDAAGCRGCSGLTRATEVVRTRPSRGASVSTRATEVTRKEAFAVGRAKEPKFLKSLL